MCVCVCVCVCVYRYTDNNNNNRAPWHTINRISLTENVISC